MIKQLKPLGGILSLVCLIMLTACLGTKERERDIKTKYIGDNSKVSQIAQSLPYPEGVSFDSIEIQSSKEPYELKVFVKVDEKQSFDGQDCAEQAFEKIENMGIISFYDKANGTLIKSFQRK